MKGKMSLFVGIAIVEHLIFTVLLAWAVYTKPGAKPDTAPIPVEILSMPTGETPYQPQPTFVVPPSQRTSIPDALQQVYPKTNVQRYLDTTQTGSGLPNLPSANLRNNQDPDRFSLGAPPSEGRSETLLDDLEATNALVRQRPLTDSPGFQGAASRPGIPNVGNQQKTKGEQGYSPSGNVATGRTPITGSSSVTGGDGTGPIRITGEVSGRGYRLGESIRTEGKQGGSVQLTFKVKPDGSVYDVRIKPGPLTTIGEVRLKEQARRYVESIRFDSLPKNARQVDQSGEIFIDFTTQTDD